MGLQIEYKQPVGVVTKEKKGGEQIMEEIKVGEPVMVPDMGIKKVGDIMEAVPYANVGMKVGKTINLQNYESLRVDVSLYMPCPPDDQSVSDTFDLVNTWVDNKMGEIIAEFDEATK